VIPVPAQSTAAKVVVEVRRAKGLTAHREEIEGFAGKMTLLRGAYDAMQATGPVAGPSLALIDAMQSGDRLSYFPEKIESELKHLQEAMSQAQADVAALDKEFEKRLSDSSRRIGGSATAPADIESEKQKRRDALHRAEALLAEAAR
jgi:alpha-glucosidase